jgi:hypothetical protein
MPHLLLSAVSGRGRCGVGEWIGNLTHEWLSQVLMYAVFAVTGFPGIVLARPVLLAGLCALSGFLAARFAANFDV